MTSVYFKTSTVEVLMFRALLVCGVFVFDHRYENVRVHRASGSVAGC